MAVPSIGRAPEPRPAPPFVRALDHAMPVELWWRVLGLIPERVNQNISLEQWSLESCAPVLRDITGLNLTVTVQQ